MQTLCSKVLSGMHTALELNAIKMDEIYSQASVHTAARLTLAFLISFFRLKVKLPFLNALLSDIMQKATKWNVESN